MGNLCKNETDRALLIFCRLHIIPPTCQVLALDWSQKYWVITRSRSELEMSSPCLATPTRHWVMFRFFA